MSLSAKNNRRRASDIAFFGIFAALMLATKLLMEVLPNIHLLATFIGVLTVVYRWRALIPLYAYVFLDGLLHGFSTWWIAYLYIFLPLVFAFLIIPTRAPARLRSVLYPAVAALHGLLFGALYTPVYAWMFGLNTWEKILASWVAGIPFDLLHAVSNAAFGTLILPLSCLLIRLRNRV